MNYAKLTIDELIHLLDTETDTEKRHDIANHLISRFYINKKVLQARIDYYNN